MSLEDPFFVVRDEVTQSLKNSEQLYERWRVLLDSPATAGGQEYDWVTGELKNSLKSIEWDLEDLDETIRAVERNPAKFRLDADEIQKRRQFVTEMRQEVKRIADHTNSSATKAKIEQSRRKDLMGSSGGSGKAQSRYQRLDNELERNNQDFIEEQLQQQQQMINQQDEQLDVVGQSVGVLKQMGEQIGDELEEQAVMLDDLDNDMDRTDNKLKGVMRKVDRALKLSDDKKQCCVILVLVIIIVVIVILFTAT
ncbi:syntaxin-6-like [Corticium candelabrum]|uniref:syntaxin-6-like n=1 Tax=Corticium candelabrum TaxID=121492 RepID=UPI002E2572E4|nr:syntaxin-6-like [Corticium candelabrum]